MNDFAVFQKDVLIFHFLIVLILHAQSPGAFLFGCSVVEVETLVPIKWGQMPQLDAARGNRVAPLANFANN
jgi:hypothetical protein